MTDLESAFAALNGKLEGYNTLFKYAEGPQPIVYSTERLQEAFGNITAHFEQNWCEVVVNSTLDRMSLKGFETEDESINAVLWDLYAEEQLGLEAYDAHYAALVTHEAFVIVWEDAEEGLEVYYNDPRLCHMFYEAHNPKKKRFGCKWWREADQEKFYLTLYYPDRLEYYVAESKNTPTSAKAFVPAAVAQAPNPYGVIPMFHLRVNRRSKASELTGIITLQDAVNKLLADMMVAAEYGAFRQRWVISNSDTEELKNAPNEIWSIPSGDGAGQASSVGDFEPTSLNNYLQAMDKLANSIAIISRTPKHYFYEAGSGVSGEALLAMEAPLTKKVAQRQEVFGQVWSEIAAFLLKIKGYDVPASKIDTTWEPILSLQPLTEAQARKYAVDAGIPLVTQLSREGWTKIDLNRMDKDKKDEEKERTSLAKQLLEEARIRQEQSNQPPVDNGEGNAQAGA